MDRLRPRYLRHFMPLRTELVGGLVGAVSINMALLAELAPKALRPILRLKHTGNRLLTTNNRVQSCTSFLDESRLLNAGQTSVKALRRQQFFMGAALDDLARPHHQYLVRLANRGQPLG